MIRLNRHEAKQMNNQKREKMSRAIIPHEVLKILQYTWTHYLLKCCTSEILMKKVWDRKIVLRQTFKVEKHFLNYH